MILDELSYYKLLDQTKSEILEILVKDQGQATVLDRLCKIVEENDHESYCSILLSNKKNKTLHQGAGPRIPNQYSDLIEGIGIAESVGSCPHAAFTKETTIVDDVYTHPNWLAYKAVIEPTGFVSCWSEPFFDVDGSVLGTFAIYKKKASSPTQIDLMFIKSVSNLASIVVKYCKAQTESKAYLSHLKDMLKVEHLKNDSLNVDLNLQIENLKLTQKKLEEEKRLSSLVNICSAFAHEVNNPLNIFKGAFAMLEQYMQDQNLLDSSTVHYIEMLDNSIYRISEMIHNIQQLSPSSLASKIDHQCHLESEIKNIIDELQENKFLTETRTKIKLDFTTNIEKVTLNPIILKRVVKEILKNSIETSLKKHSDKDFQGEHIIKLSVSNKNHELKLDFYDNGQGIDKSIQEQIFIPFVTSKQGKEGPGLGASIAKCYVDYLGGDIKINSEANEFTEVKISIPLN